MAFGTRLLSNLDIAKQSIVGAYKGASGAWSSGMAGKGVRSLFSGNQLKYYGAGGALAGAGVGAVAGGRDHRVSGAVAGGLMGGGAGLGGRILRQNWNGAKSLYRGAISGGRGVRAAREAASAAAAG